MGVGFAEGSHTLIKFDIKTLRGLATPLEPTATRRKHQIMRHLSAMMFNYQVYTFIPIDIFIYFPSENSLSQMVKTFWFVPIQPFNRTDGN